MQLKNSVLPMYRRVSGMDSYARFSDNSVTMGKQTIYMKTLLPLIDIQIKMDMRTSHEITLETATL
jgi:hypothetical protein